ncbi:MAG: hypothetical protein KDE67_10735 [Sphingobium sp.]|nr:hypothetical protein [Sphingobium sp.]MCP5397697.1 hypothetical protein [Sphingomonas sp.]
MGKWGSLFKHGVDLLRCNKEHLCHRIVMGIMMTPDTNPLFAQVRDMMQAAGIENFRFVDGVLIMCGSHYEIEKCSCDDPECNGLRLNKIPYNAALQ